ncbi:MAG TPA: hypothetical protein VFF40_01615 [Acidimicrobiia bacterium]|nr:hypothetical protein [Acidimicrobiia bacterium]
MQLETARETSRQRERRGWWIWFAVAFVVMATWASSMPIFGAHDE